MAINFGKGKDTLFASTDLMSFGKAFSRMAAQPLDMYEVWYDYDALVAYAANTDSATATAYVGQKVAYIDADNKVTHYSIEADGSLKELGTTPVGDEKSIEVDENGTISLKGVGTLVFEREVEGQEEKEEVKFQPLMTKNGLVWVEPSKTTVEGLATLIDELTQRIGALETKVGKDAEGEVPATGLFKAIADEVARATAAEKALGERIDGIDYVDEQELSEALTPYATTQYVDGINNSIAGQIGVASREEGPEGGAQEATGLHKKIEDETARATVAEERIEKKIDDFLVGTGAEDVIDTLVEIQNALDSLVDPTELATAIANKADRSELDNYVLDSEYQAHLTAQSEKDSAQDTAIAGKEDAGVAAGLVDAAKTELQGKIDNKVDNTTYNEHLTAQAEADRLQNDTIATKADSSYVGIIPSNYTETNVIAYVNKKAEEVLSQATGGSSESAASVKLALDTYKSENEPKFAKLEAIEAGAQVNVLESVKAKSGAKITVSDITNKGVEIDDSALVTLINTAQSKADSAYALADENKTGLTTLGKTVSDNKQAADAVALRVTDLETATSDLATIRTNIQTNATDINTNKTDIATIKKTLNGEGDTVGLISRVSTLETAEETHKGQYTALLGTVTGHTARFDGMGETDTVVGLVNEAKAAAAAADTKAQNAANAVTALETGKVKANADAISALDERVTALDKADGKIATIEGAISGLDTRLTALDKDNGRIALIEGRVSTNEGEITAIKGQLTGLTGAMHFRGSVTADPTVTAPTLDPAAASGDVVLYDGKEYIYDGSKWAIFGDEGSYALKDSVYTKSEVYTKTEVNDLQTAQDTAHEALIAAAEGRAAADATSKANAAEANAKAYTDTALTWADMPDLEVEG